MTDDTDLFRTRGFGKKLGFGDRPALIIVDLVKAFTTPDLPLGSDLTSQIAASNRLIAAARVAELPVIFTTVAYDDPQLRDAGLWLYKQSGAHTQKADGTGIAVDDRLKREDGDQMLRKKFASIFFGTDLVSRLTFLRVDTLVFAGCSTSGCIRSSVVDAIQYGFRPMVVAEAVGDRSQSAHDQSLFDIDAKYGDVIGLDEACAEMTVRGMEVRT